MSVLVLAEHFAKLDKVRLNLDPEKLIHGSHRGDQVIRTSLRVQLKAKGYDKLVTGKGVALRKGEMLFEGTTLKEAVTNASHFDDSLASVCCQFTLTPVERVAQALEIQKSEFTAEELLFGPTEADAESVLAASRIYRAAQGNMVNFSTKLSQCETRTSGDVFNKFRGFGQLGKVLMAGAGDYLRRTHLGLQCDSVELLDPQIDGRALTEDTDLSAYDTLVSDAAGRTLNGGLEDMASLNGVYESLHQQYPNVRMILKVNLAHLPHLDLKLLRKPKPHNLEAIVEVFHGSEIDVEHELNSIVLANHARNRGIRDQVFKPAPFSRADLNELEACVDYRMGPKTNPRLMPRSDPRALVSKKDFIDLLKTRSNRRNRALSFLAVTWVASNAKRCGPGGFFVLDNYPHYYTHACAEAAVAALDMAVGVLGLRRTGNGVDVLGTPASLEHNYALALEHFT